MELNDLVVASHVFAASRALEAEEYYRTAVARRMAPEPRPLPFKARTRVLFTGRLDGFELTVPGATQRPDAA